MVETLVVFGLFLLLLLIGLPIAFTFFISGLVGISLFRGIESGVSLAGMSPFSEGSNYILLAIPLFILLGQFVFSVFCPCTEESTDLCRGGIIRGSRTSLAQKSFQINPKDGCRE